MDSFPDIIEKAALNYQPHLIANYLFSLAQDFNEFYHRYPVLKVDNKTRDARLILVKTVNQVLDNGLKLLGIQPLEKM